MNWRKKIRPIHPVVKDMSPSENTIQREAATPIADDFLPSLYRITLALGIVVTIGLLAVTHSLIWAGSFIFGVIASLAFLKAQEIFLKRLLASGAPRPAAVKAPKSLWAIMAGKYLLLAGIMAGALHFQVLNLIAFVFGFAMLHLVMIVKVVGRRAAGSKETVTTDAPRHRVV